MDRFRRWAVRLLAGFGALVIAIIILAGVLGAVFGGKDHKDADRVDAQPSPTLTDAESGYVAAVATAQAVERANAAETFEARPTDTPRPTATPVPPPYKLALISGSCTRRTDIGFIECEGFVRNLTAGALDHVTAVVVYTDAAGTPLASDDALIDYDPILAGQQSPWSVIGTYNPAYEKYRFEFKELLGGSILTRDDRQP